MVAAARQGTAADAVVGVAPRLVAEPSTVAEAAEILRSCAGDKLAVAFAGGGTELDLGAPPRALDVLVRTTHLSAVVEYLPSDQIAVVEAGITMAALQRQLAEHGQRLALDPPLADRATVGGVVASNAFGPRRLRYGTARDLVVGMTLVRADGVVARGGGKVVKNVAGFDVPRLMVGSCGTLALIATVAVRLHPLPEAAETVLVSSLTAERVRGVVKSLVDAQLEPTSAAAVDEGGALRVGLRFEGFAPGVAEQRDRFLALAKRGGLAAEPLDDRAARAFWDRHDALRTEGSFRATLTAPPAALAQAHAAAVAPIARALRPGGALLYPTLGVAFASGDPAGAEAVADAVTAARAALAPLGGSVVLHAAPAAVRERVDPWGAPDAGVLALMKRVKAQLDPDGRLAPGRYVGGI